MAKGNNIVFECDMPDAEAQGRELYTRDMGDDYSTYLVRANGELWLTYSDETQETMQRSLFSGVVETQSRPNDYRAEFKDGLLVGKVEILREGL